MRSDELCAVRTLPLEHRPRESDDLDTEELSLHVSESSSLERLTVHVPGIAVHLDGDPSPRVTKIEMDQSQGRKDDRPLIDGLGQGEVSDQAAVHVLQLTLRRRLVEGSLGDEFSVGTDPSSPPRDIPVHEVPQLFESNALRP